MRVERRDGSDERKILTSMIVSDNALAQIASIWKPDSFQSTWANLVGGWCISYFSKYGKAPGEAIEDRFNTYASSPQCDDASARLVEKFLARLSRDFQNAKDAINVEYIADLAQGYFNRTRLKQLSSHIDGLVDAGDISRALEEVETFSHADIGTGTVIDVLNDASHINEAFEEYQKPLISFPGALGEFINPEFVRDSFIAFLAPEKRGKSWALLDVAWRAILQKKRVLYFECGDNSKNQVYRRIMTRACRRPMFPRSYNYPTAIKRKKDERDAEVEIVEKAIHSKFTPARAYEQFQRVLKKKNRDGQPMLHLSVHPASSLSTATIRSKMKALERRGWVPDVVIIDYADILEAPAGVRDLRDQINENWKRLRAISQEFHCLLATATQADAQSANVWYLTRKNFSDDKRKIGHVTALFGINQTEEEKELGIYRYNQIASRNHDFKESKCVYLASCLPIANIAVRSCW